MVSWAVYWQEGRSDPDCVFFTTKAEAIAQIDKLIKKAEDLTDETGTPDWEITLLEVKGEVQQVPFRLGWALVERKETK